jgi:predicted nucleic acid-binding protein
MTAATSPGRPFLLDTSVILHLVRGNSLGQQIRDTYDLHHCQPRPLVCVVSLAEARVLAETNGWGEAKRNALDTAFRSLTVVNISHPTVIDAYVKLDLHARSHPLGARRMGKNDLWIAATAVAANAFFLTTDKDFECLIPSHVQGQVISVS